MTNSGQVFTPQQNPILLQEACRTYAAWLGIPPGASVPNHYLLLGLPQGTSDQHQIIAAAGRQAALVRTMPSDMAHPQLQQALLEQIALAQACLLDPARKATYDAQLRPGSAALPRPIPVSSAMQALHEVELSSPADVSTDRFPGASPNPSGRFLSARNAAPAEPVSTFTTRHKQLAAATGVLLVLICAAAWLFVDRDSPLETEPAAVAILPEEIEPAPPAEAKPTTPTDSLPSPADSREPEVAAGSPTEDRAIESSVTAASAAEEAEAAEAEIDARPMSNPMPRPVSRARTNPFTLWHTELTLPPRSGPSSALAEGPATVSESMVLGPLPADAPMALRLDYAAADLGRHLGLQVVADPGAPAGAWRIEFVKVEPAGRDDSILNPDEITPTEPVGYLELVRGRLVFRWNEACQEPRGDQLRNCVLKLTSGRYHHALRLRKVEQLPVHVLNLSGEGETIALQSAPLPPHESLFLQVEPGLAFANDWGIEPANRRVRLSEELRLVHVTAPEAEIVFRLVESEGTLRVQIACYYTLSERRYPFSEEKVRTTLINLQKTLVTNRNRIVAAQATGRNLIAEMERVRTAPLPSGPARPGEIMRRKGLLADLGGQVKKMEGTVSRLRNSIPKTATAVAEMEQVATLGQELHQQAQLNFHIGTETLHGDVLLVEIGALP